MGSKYCVQRALTGSLLLLLVVGVLGFGLPNISTAQDNNGPIVDDDWLRKSLPQLNNPRLVTDKDIQDKVERDTYRKEGWSFVLKGDFNKDGLPDYCIVGKYDGSYPGKSIFVAIFTQKKEGTVLEFLYKHTVPGSAAFLKREKGSDVDIQELPPVAKKFDIVFVSFALYTDYASIIIWNGTKFVMVHSDL